VMLTKNGPRVLEFNCRFGDPETLVLLPLLSSDLYSIALNCALGNLDVNSVQFYDDRSALCIVHVSRGYPGAYEKNKEIRGLNLLSTDKSYVVHAGTSLQSGTDSIVTQGGRVLAVIGIASTLREAQSLALASSLKISFDGAFYRKDIGEQALKSSKSQSLTYASAGVSIAAGDELVRLIKPAAKATERVGCASTLGLFGALFDLKAVGYKDPLLVSGTDGVGTKLKVAMAVKQHRTVGQDLVAMCVNDILCHGAESLFFLYY
jgi:phosphoribosylamine--glycine ligase/phosphoribosylglycinamide formyltransferase/phosphoribosylformylglycinamidine cyclo-ligase